jgi:heme-degrading monooxygenase HmoA
MIARVWHGTTSKENQAAYLGYLTKTAKKEFKRLKGNAGALILVRESDEETEFLVISLWKSMSAIRKFAGKDPNKPVYYVGDIEYLLRLTSVVKHYKVAAKI